MCFVLTLFRVNDPYPLVVAANRNESRARPSRSPYRWPGEPTVWAGRDEVAGGTWLGVNSNGLLVAITNRRDGPTDPSLPSRGRLCLEALRAPSPSAARLYVEGELRAHRYNPFNLLCADPAEGWVATWRGDIRALSPGVHVLTNEGDLDDAALPMVQRALASAAQLDSATAQLESLLRALGVLCADTAGPSPICRVGGRAGTVSSSLIAIAEDGTIAAYWHADGPPSSYRYQPVSCTTSAGNGPAKKGTL